MTEIEINIERAIERLEFMKKHELQSVDKLSFAAIKMAILALEKQMPKIPSQTLRYDFGIGGKCLTCSGLVREGQNYCTDCGQRLNWD